MSIITINRGEFSAVKFDITDPVNNALLGKRVTLSLALFENGPRVLRKVSAMPGSSAEVTITSQTAGAISGYFNILVADFTTLTEGCYRASIWVDSNIADDKCMTPGGFDLLKISGNVPRAA